MVDSTVGEIPRGAIPFSYCSRDLAGWVAACALGETLGVAATSVAVYFANLLISELGWSVNCLPAVLTMMLVAGGVEVACLAALQSRALQHFVPTLPRAYWIFATAAAACLGWFAGMLPSSFALTYWKLTSMDVGSSTFSMFTVGPLLGAFSGVLIGTAQWLTLRSRVAHAGTWVAANTIGWALAMIPVSLGATVPDRATDLLTTVLVGAGSGLAAGLMIGVATGVFLLRHLPQRPSGLPRVKHSCVLEPLPRVMVHASAGR